MTLPDGIEAKDGTASGADHAPGVEQAVAMHRAQADEAEAAVGRVDLSAAIDRQAPDATSTAGTFTAGTSTPGTSTAGASSAGTSSAGASSAGMSSSGMSSSGMSPAGTWLADTAVEVDPFLAKGTDPEPAGSRSIKSVLLDYSAHAAMIVGLIGFAWTVSDHVVTRQASAQVEAPGGAAPAGPPRQAAAAPKDASKDTAKDAGKDKPDELAELRSANERMARDVEALRVELGTVRTALGRDPTPDQLRALAGDLEGVKAGLNTVKGETTTAIAALSGRIEKSQRETNAKVQQLAAAGPIERGGVDTTATGSIAPGDKGGDRRGDKAAEGKPAEAHAPPVPVAKPATKLAGAEDGREDGRRASPEKAADEAPAKPPVLSGWVVRAVYQGVALIEGRRGELEVVPGVSIPGAGIVKSIDRRGSGWTVTTTKGLLAYAAPQRDYRRAARDYYPGPRDDF